MKKKDLPLPPVNRQRDRPLPPDRQRKHIVQRNEGETTPKGMFYIHENVFPCHVFLCKFGSCTGVHMFHIHHDVVLLLNLPCKQASESGRTDKIRRSLMLLHHGA
jgi:hypothetical protein